MTTDETGQRYVYDAWNRLVEVKDSSGDVEASYSYDGLGRRITDTASGTTTDLYFSSQGQALEEYVSGSATERYVWSPVYVNALVLRDTLSDGSISQRLYVLQDANWNVTALVNTSGSVVERYMYSPYGVVTVIAPDWSTRESSDYGWLYLFQGGRYDSATGDYQFDARAYRPTTGQWMQEDPLMFQAGDADLRRYVKNDPTNATDPGGEEEKKKTDGYRPIEIIPGWYYCQPLPPGVIYDPSHPLGGLPDLLPPFAKDLLIPGVVITPPPPGSIPILNPFPIPQEFITDEMKALIGIPPGTENSTAEEILNGVTPVVSDATGAGSFGVPLWVQKVFGHGVNGFNLQNGRPTYTVPVGTMLHNLVGLPEYDLGTLKLQAEPDYKIKDVLDGKLNEGCKITWGFNW